MTAVLFSVWFFNQDFKTWIDWSSHSTDSKPQPYCFEYDDQAAVHLCAIFYNTTFTETQVSACLKLSIQVQAQIIIPLKCFTLSRPTAITVRGEDLENIVTEIMV